MSRCARRSIRARGERGRQHGRKARTKAANARRIVIVSVICAVVFVLAQGLTSYTSIEVAIFYGLLLSVAIGVVELFVLQGPMRVWLGGLSFAANLAVRSAIYAAIIVPTQFFEVGSVLAGQPVASSMRGFWIAMVYSVVFSIAMNLAFGITNIIGRRAFLNFILGRYHAPVEENRFVLFVDIAGSTGLAERLGGIGIHRLLDRTFRSSYAFGGGLSRRGSQLCRRRSDRAPGRSAAGRSMAVRCAASWRCAMNWRARRASCNASSELYRGFAAACISGR